MNLDDCTAFGQDGTSGFRTGENGLYLGTRREIVSRLF